jgi:hypothetical protein
LEKKYDLDPLDEADTGQGPGVEDKSLD